MPRASSTSGEWRKEGPERREERAQPMLATSRGTGSRRGPSARAAVEMDPVVLAGCLFILLNCGGLVGVSLAHRQRLPGWCGWAMVGCYAAYLATVLALVVAL